MTIETLRELADIEVVAENLGLDTKRIGSRVSCLCPFHNDHNHGSSFLINNRLICFACGTSANAFDLVIQVRHCSFNDAAKYVAQSMGTSLDIGCPDHYHGFSKVKVSKKEMDILHIPQTAISLSKLYAMDAELYRETIKRQALKMKDHYIEMLSQYSDRSSPGALRVYKLFSGHITPQIYSELRQEIERRITTCDEIARRVEDEKEG